MKIKYLKSKDERNKDFNKLIAEKYPHFLTEEHPDLVLVTGGDGALLHAIQSHNHLQIPFLGRAGGTLNFLMNPMEEADGMIAALMMNEAALHIIETTSMSVSVQKQTGEVDFIGYAINEVVIGTHVMGYHAFSITSKDSSFSDFSIKGSGVCVSSDLGSTGYNFNLGGAVLPLGSNLWSVTGVVCNRYLDDIINIQPLRIQSLSERSRTSIYVDGMEKRFVVGSGDTVLLEGGQIIKIAFLNKEDFIKRRLEITSRYRKY